MAGRHLRVAFCHPDLGLGGDHRSACAGVAGVNASIFRIKALLIAGAERLIVDAADEIAERDHIVSQACVCRQ